MNHCPRCRSPVSFSGLWVSTEICPYSGALALKLWFGKHLTFDVDVWMLRLKKHADLISSKGHLNPHHYLLTPAKEGLKL